MHVSSQAPEEETEQKSGCISNWLGILVFLLVMGSQFIQPAFQALSQFIGQNTAQQLGSSLSAMLPMIIVGVVILSIAVPIITSIIRGIGQASGGNDVPARTSLPPTSSPPASLEQARLPSTLADYQNTSSIPGSSGSTYSSMPRSANLEELNLGDRPKRHYQTPGFEPILDGHVVVFGIMAVFAIAAAIAGGIWLSSVLP